MTLRELLIKLRIDTEILYNRQDTIPNLDLELVVGVDLKGYEDTENAIINARVDNNKIKLLVN